MKLETTVDNAMKKVLPSDTVKTIVYANVTETSYEIYFYVFDSTGTCRQCYELAEQDILDENLLDATFERLAGTIRADQDYRKECGNLYTFQLDADGIRKEIRYLNENDRIYRVKKEWKQTYLKNVK